MGKRTLILLVSLMVFVPVCCFGERFYLEFVKEHYMIEARAGYGIVEDYGDTDGFNMDVAQVSLTFGYSFVDDVLVYVTLPYYSTMAKDDLKAALESMGEDTTINDLGDLGIGFIMQKDVDITDSYVYLGGDISLPTADEDNYGNGVARYEFTLGFAYEGSSYLVDLFASYELGPEAKDANWDNTNIISFGIDIGARIQPNIGLSVSYRNTQSYYDDEDNEILIGLLFEAKFALSHMLHIGAMMGRNDYSPDMVGMLGYSMEF
jgi:hypothetical protein